LYSPRTAGGYEMFGREGGVLCFPEDGVGMFPQEDVIHLQVHTAARSRRS